MKKSRIGHVLVLLEEKDFLKKSDYSVPGILFCRILSLPATIFLIKLRVAPNVITAGSLLIVMAGAVSWLQGFTALAISLMGIGALLDFSDGMVARYLKKSSVIGGYFDYFSDRVKSIIIIYCTTATLSIVWIDTCLYAGMLIIVVRETVQWFCPYELVCEKYSTNRWDLLLGKWGKFGNGWLRNDPWQLVAAAILGLFLGLGVFKYAMLYYSLTILVDFVALVRAYINIGPGGRRSGERLLIRKNNYSVKRLFYKYYSKLLGRSTQS